jgi:GTP pyrophosphokinase
MQSKGIVFEVIYDLYAVRIVFGPLAGVDEKSLCWDIYSAITDIYQIRPKRIRDWVGCPKTNGDQTLHLTVMGPDGEWIEIQIRSRRMGDIAEKGLAAHWKYKESNKEIEDLDFPDTIKLDLCSSDISVFTPKGDIKTLPQGATVLDFAYALHTDIGNGCLGAKINHRLVPLSHRLTSGDQIEILTSSRSQKPQPEWLSFVATAKARAKIHSALKRIRKEGAKKGEEKVIAAFKKAGIETNSSQIDKLALYFGFPKREDFFYSVEKGNVMIPDNIKKIVKDKTDSSWFRSLRQALGIGSKENVEAGEPTKEKPTFDKTKPYILSEGTYNLNYVVAQCCKPIPGDDALGFINDDGAVVVHKRSCPIAMRLKASFGNRILTTEWSSHKTASFEATLEVVGIDAFGVSAITKIISDEFNVNIQHLHIEANDGVFEGRIKLKVLSVEDIQRLCVTLSKIKNVKSVGRIAE